MADFTIDVSRSKTSRINLGIQGENIIEHIIFDISGWIEEFGEGVAYIYAQRKGDENPYPVALDMDMENGTATWTITDADTAIKGKGKAQLVFVSDDEDSITDVDAYSASSTYSVGEYCLYGTQLYKCKTTISTPEAWTAEHWDAVNEVKKTRVYATTVQASLVATSSENPDAYETWLEVLGGYTARIEAAEDDIKAWVTAQINAINFPVDDVQVDGTSVVSGGVAEIPKATRNQFGVVEITAQADAPGGYADIVGEYKIQVPYVTDANGVVIPIRSKYLPDATTTDKGAMSAADKAKLDGIGAGAEANVQADWNQTDTSADDYVKNKPTIPTIPDVATTSSNGLMSSTDKVKLNGIGAGAEANVQSDWNQTDNTADDFIKNKPTIPDVPDIEGTSPINVDDTTDTLVVSHEASGVTAGTYDGYYSSTNGFYMPSLTVDEEGHVTSASGMGTFIPNVNATSQAFGVISVPSWASAVRSADSGFSTYRLFAGETTRTWNIYDNQSPDPYSMGIQDISCFDVSTHEAVMVDWSVNRLYSGGKINYISLTVSIDEAYEHDICVFPIVTHRISGM